MDKPKVTKTNLTRRVSRRDNPMEALEKIARAEKAAIRYQKDVLDLVDRVEAGEVEELTIDETQEIGFIPDWDPELTIQENLDNVQNNPGKQARFLMAIEDEVLFAGTRGPLAYGEKVLTRYGFKNIEDVRVGDWVICPDTTKSQVIQVPFDGEDECYEIEFIDGRKVIVGQDHLWEVEIANRKLKEGSRRSILKTTNQLVEHFDKNVRGKVGNKDWIQHILIPLCDPIPFDKHAKVRYEVDPYLLGLLLGDGCLRGKSVTLTTKDDQIVQYCVDNYKNGVSYNENSLDIRFRSPKELIKDLESLKVYGKLSNNKFVPKKYLKAHLDVRLEVLRGLLDTDGTADKDGRISFCSTSEQLAKDVQELVRSVGGKATITDSIPHYLDETGERVYCNKAYKVYIQTKNNANLFKLQRKIDRCLNKPFNGGNSELKLRIKDITYVGKRKCKCITIDDPRGLFITNDYIVTHNSAKSLALVADPLPYFANPNFRALLIRRTMPDLRELIKRCQNLYSKVYPGVKWKEQSKTFVFPSGATMEMGYCERREDLERYQGQEYYWMGFDEIAQHSGSWIIDDMVGSLRGTDTSIPKLIRATCNPWGAGKQWVMERWNIEFDHHTGEGNYEVPMIIEYDTPIGKLRKTRKWFFGHWKDNKALVKSDPNFVANLYSITDDSYREAMLHGSWDAVVGLAFPEFKPTTHVIKPFKIPDGWYKWRSCDWGYSTLGVVLWFATDWDNNVYVYREYTAHRIKADEFASTVLALEKGEYIQEGYIDGSVMANRGEVGISIIDTMADEGLFWTPADRSPGSRIAGKQAVHRYLATEQDALGKLEPKLKIFDTCTELIKELKTLQIDKNNPEDIDKATKSKHPDHAYDALRYGLSAAPDENVEKPTYTSGELIGRFHSPSPLIVDSRYGY